MKILKPTSRIHYCPIPVVAITGGIASGKSFILRTLANKGCFVISADDLVKSIYSTSENLRDFLRREVPEVLKENIIDFVVLRSLFFQNSTLKSQLENIIYQEIGSHFKKTIEGIKHKYLFYEVPLLFEKKLANQVDFTVLAHAARETQVQRVQMRDNTPIQTINKILDQQIPLSKKVSLVDFVIHTENNNTYETEISELLVKLDELFA